MADPLGGAAGTPRVAAGGIEQARALARERFKTRVVAGEPVGGCGCDEDGRKGAGAGEPAARVVGVRFRDSGRTYYFEPGSLELEVGAWVVVETERGEEAGRVVIAPSQVRLALIDGEIKRVRRRMGDEDVRRMERRKGNAAEAVKRFGALVRERRLAIKPVAAEFAFDGSRLTISYSLPERDRAWAPGTEVMQGLTSELGRRFGCTVELRQVGPREEARLLGGLGRCGRTLCCSSWLPVFPEISTTMARTQDLALNPSKVSGVCGRLLCCLSYENEQYKQMKAVMPRLGQPIETPAGPGMVVSLQILKELVTVRLAADGQEIVFPSGELGLASRRPATEPMGAVPASVGGGGDVGPGGNGEGGDRKRRRRRGRRGGGMESGRQSQDG